MILLKIYTGYAGDRFAPINNRQIRITSTLKDWFWDKS